MKAGIMWPTLLNMTRDDCRRTLRRLELEAYSNMISVFRAQGALEDNRKKLLEELRGVLHISTDRHTAEARRAANDELLATIAEQLSGPNTGLGWISEGRRRVPLMPRGIPQTAYTDIADRAALQASVENEQIVQKNIEAEKNVLVAPKSNPDGVDEDAEMPDVSVATAEDGKVSDYQYPPVVMEDQSMQFLEAEAPRRKRFRPESGSLPQDVASTSPQIVRNTNRNTNQKHLNLSQIYLSYSKTPTGKQSGHSKHSYNQVSKVSSKANQLNTSRTTSKHRMHKHTASITGKTATQIVISKSQMKSPTEMPVSATMSLASSTPLRAESANMMAQAMDFQGSFVSNIKGSTKNLHNEYIEDVRINSQNVMVESPTMQLLTQPAAVPQDIGVLDPIQNEDPSSLQAQSSVLTQKIPQTVSGKPCHLIIKKKGEIVNEKQQNQQKVQVSGIQILQKPAEGIKVLPNRQVIVAPNCTQKALNATTKLITTKIVQHIPSKMPQQMTISSSAAPVYQNTDKLVVVSSSHSQLNLANSAAPKSVGKNIIITSTNVTVPASNTAVVESLNFNKGTEDSFNRSGIGNDAKLPTKTFLLNSTNAPKMVVLPAKARGKASVLGQSVPFFQMKGIPGRPTTMKLVPVSNQTVNPAKQSTNVAMVPKVSAVNTVPPNAKIVSVESLKPIISSTTIADANSTNAPKILQNVQLTPKTSGQAIVRTAGPKGNIIVVQKGTTIGKGGLTFAKNGNDISKLMLGKTATQVQSSVPVKSDGIGITPSLDSPKNSNIIVLELNNDRLARQPSMTEILEVDGAEAASRASVRDADEASQAITEDTPVLFDTQMNEESCNTNSMDSIPDGIVGLVPIDTDDKTGEENSRRSDGSEGQDGTEDASSVADWGAEGTSVKEKADSDMNSLHLDVGMSSDSETDSYLVKDAKRTTKASPTDDERRRDASLEESSATYARHGGMTHPSGTLLSQLQDDGSSSNDSSFAASDGKRSGLVRRVARVPCQGAAGGGDVGASDGPKREEEKGSERRMGAKQRVDIFSTALASAEINLDSYEYLEDGMITGDEMFVPLDAPKPHKEHGRLDMLLGENVSVSSTNSVSGTSALTK